MKNQTDHKPLETLYQKPLHASPMRIQGMMLKLQSYTSQLKYRKGTTIGLVDCLSKKPLHVEHQGDESYIDDNLTVGRIDTLSSPKHKKLRKIHRLTIQLIQNGWPELRKDLPDHARLYWDSNEDMSTYDGIVYKGERIHS